MYDTTFTIDRPYGAEWDPQAGGTHFRTFSGAVATQAVVRLFGPDGEEIVQTKAMDREARLGSDGPWDWYTFVPNVGPGQQYAFGVDGPFNLADGHRYWLWSHAVDPAARALATNNWGDPYAVRSVVADPAFCWDGDQPLSIPPQDLAIYELHPRGYTIFHPDVTEDHRGTYLGLAETAPLQHLVDLGATHMELMPVQSSIPGQGGYWKYWSLLWGALDPSYGFGDNWLLHPVQFKQMVKAAHSMKLGVILDVVFNHTAEGSEEGPTLMLKLLDNTCYFLKDGEFYENRTGCGNTVRCSHPAMVRLIVQMLRRWVLEYHVDGFRFDLAGDVFSDMGGFYPTHPLLVAILNDPVIAPRVLSGEQWSALGGSACMAHLPEPFLIWSDDFKKSIRRIVRGDWRLLSDFTRCLDGAHNVDPSGSVHYPRVSYVSCHDGAVMRDLVERDDHEKLNRNDGEEHNFGHNCGAFGPTDNPEVLGKRRGRLLAFWALQACTAGPILIEAGSEIGRTAAGHNNPYSEHPWWGGDWLNAMVWPEHSVLCKFARGVMGLRNRFPGLRSHRMPEKDETFWDRAYGWYNPDGFPLTEHSQRIPGNLATSLYIPNSGPVIDETTPFPGSLLVMVNMNDWDRHIVLPRACEEPGRYWLRVLYSLAADPFAEVALRDYRCLMESKGVAYFVSIAC